MFPPAENNVEAWLVDVSCEKSTDVCQKAGSVYEEKGKVRAFLCCKPTGNGGCWSITLIWDDATPDGRRMLAQLYTTI